MKNICVFCGAASGNSEKYIKQAFHVGKIITEKNYGLVYGGGKDGLMGAVANSVLKHSGQVIGVIPENFISAEVAHHGVTTLHIVKNMHERKKMMYELSDAFLILPGGMGTLDELFEIATWAQLKFHEKPIYILNEFGFYDLVLNYLKFSASEGFIKNVHLDLLIEIKSAEDLISIL